MIRRYVLGQEALGHSEACHNGNHRGTSRCQISQPAKIESGAQSLMGPLKHEKLDLQTTGDQRKVQLNELIEVRWSGHCTIVQVFPYGTVELSQNSGPNFKVNGHRLKHYFGGDIPAMDIPDLQTFPKDN
ncbi:hypothetical protein Tco_0217533 [Tanacetum coccineum]